LVVLDPRCCLHVYVLVMSSLGHVTSSSLSHVWSCHCCGLSSLSVLLCCPCHVVVQCCHSCLATCHPVSE